MTLIAPSSTAAAAADARRVCRIVLIDGQRIFRQALRILFAAQDEFAVVGDAGRGSEALELIEALHPDVVVTELHLADGSGVELIDQIHARSPEVAILVLTALHGRDRVAAARKAGALGYLLKERGRSELLAALRAVAAGRRYRASAPAEPVSRALAREDSSYLSTRAAYLTELQRQVLRSVALGHRTRDIAQMLGLSVKAVHKQRERLRNSLQLNNTAALTRFAVCEGLAEEDAPSH